MAIGATIRGAFGRHERKVADLYRSLFIDLEDFARQVQQWAPTPEHILEVGCGEGAVTEKLAQLYPEAKILAIDLTPRLGRLYEGRRDGVTFCMTPVQEVAKDFAGSFDLIIMSDVMHHIPLEQRGDVLVAIGQALAPEGQFILKDWEKTRTPIHWLCHAGDRWLTGDHVTHITPDAAQRLVAHNAPPLKLRDQEHIAPWQNNYAQLFAR